MNGTNNSGTNAAEKWTLYYMNIIKNEYLL